MIDDLIKAEKLTQILSDEFLIDFYYDYLYEGWDIAYEAALSRLMLEFPIVSHPDDLHPDESLIIECLKIPVDDKEHLVTTFTEGEIIHINSDSNKAIDALVGCNLLNYGTILSYLHVKKDPLFFRFRSYRVYHILSQHKERLPICLS